MNPKTYLNYINGQWVPSCTGKTFKVINPANRQLIALAQQSNEDDMQSAIEAAAQSFEKTNWRKNSALRCQALMELAKLLSEKSESLARLNSSDNGKIIAEARVEISSSIDSIQYFATMARAVYGRTIDPAENSLSVIVREPIGVVGIISAWNWPVTLMIRDMIPALAAGNAVVIKPATNTAAISMEVVEILSQVKDIPAGIVNVVTGPGQLIGEVLTESDKVGMVSFTGDSITGKRIAELASKTMKKISLELGGKSPNVIFADADLDKAIPVALKAAFTTCGQVCLAGTRLIVQDTILNEVVQRIKIAVENMKIGNGLEEDCQLGPLVSQNQLDTVMKYIEIGKKEGKLLSGGYRLTGEDYDNGFFVAPTIFTDLNNNSQVVQEEIFGPVLVIQKFHTEMEAIELANSTKFGLAGAVWTLDVNRAIRVAREIKAGTVWINTYSKTFHQCEFGGYKESGIGRARGMEGLLEYTEIKHINFDISPA